MAMSERVARLRQQSLDARPAISTERAELMTELYRQNEGLMSAPVERALAFQYLMEQTDISIRTTRYMSQTNTGQLWITIMSYTVLTIFLRQQSPTIELRASPACSTLLRVLPITSTPSLVLASAKALPDILRSSWRWSNCTVRPESSDISIWRFS